MKSNLYALKVFDYCGNIVPGTDGRCPRPDLVMVGIATRSAKAALTIAAPTVSLCQQLGLIAPLGSSTLSAKRSLECPTLNPLKNKENFVRLYITIGAQ
jgi:hypothetical protein